MAEKQEKLIEIKNGSRATLVHGKFILEAGKTVKIPVKVAEIWLKIDGVTEYVEPKAAKEAEAELKTKIGQLQKEISEKDEMIKLLEEENTELKEKIGEQAAQ